MWNMYPSRFAVEHGAGADSPGCDLDDPRDLQGFADEVAEPVVAARIGRSSRTDPGNSGASPYNDRTR
jgi:hypothetical protein